MRSGHFQDMYRQESYYWWHVARRRLVHYLINQKLPLKAKVLDVGCGTGKLLQELFPKFNAYGLDISSAAVTYAKSRAPQAIIKKADISRHIPFTTKFDAVIALDVLEHIKNDTKTIANVFAVLKKGGIFLISVPAFPFVYSYWDQTLHHFRRYQKSTLIAQLTQAGFTITLATYYNSLLFIPALIFRFLKVTIFGKKAQNISDFHEVPKPINFILKLWLEFEGKLAIHYPLPVGLSLLVVAHKK